VEDSDRVLIEELGKRICFYRKQKGLTQADLSDLADMEESAVRRIELEKQIQLSKPCCVFQKV
jgi:transcriptional regulator with XRE-family HTH domain